LPQYSFVDILNGQIQPTQLSHKIILVGATAAGLNSLITPFDQSPPANGVHLQATLLNNLLQQNLLRPVHGPLWLGGLLLSNLIWGALLRPLRIVHQLCWTSILLVGWWCIAVAALGQHYWLPVALPIGLWLSTTVIHGLMANRQLEAKTRRLHYLANIDELTQVSNRRAFEQYLQREWQRSLREQQPISLILGDVDFFKQFNDYYGHLAGDTCLYQVAQLLQSSTKRPTDMVARYGGEEFAIILPNTDAAGAQKLATLILGQMRAQLIPHPASEISHYVTLSLGSATAIPNRQIDWYNLVDVADRALYAAKFQGRDRACSETLNRDPSNGATEAAIVTV
jgi:diguanylate cyclase (GGDEF)-like protein